MKNVFTIIEEFFYVSSAALIIFCVLELAVPKFVIPYINLNVLLILVLISGIFAAVLR